MTILHLLFNRFHALTAVGMVLGLSTSPSAQPPQDPGGYRLAASDPLSPLNASFRASYSERRSRAIAETGPIIVHLGDRMVLIKDGVRTEAPSVTVRYHELKAVAHVPLAIYVMLIPGGDSELEQPRLARLRGYREQVQEARDSMAGRGFRPEQLERQLRILTASLALLDSVLDDGSVTRDELHRFARSQGRDLLANTHEAAEDQIDTMDRQIRTWLAAMTPVERDRLRVAVGSSHMARVGNLAMQYFSRLMDEPSEGRFEEEETKQGGFRLISSESLFDEEAVLQLLGTHLVDRDVGARFFGDAQRMHRDLLADAAEELVRERFGR